MKTEISAGIVTYTEKIMQDKLHRLYLVLHSKKGHWDLPKGKLEAGESNLEAAIRELKEETGLMAQIIPGFEQSIEYMFKDTSNQLIEKHVTFFLGKVTQEKVILSDEHLYYKWLPLEDAIKQISFSNAKQMLKMADNYLDR
jgi:bis(5'-nucleosidyl)-tetraphosphatase